MIFYNSEEQVGKLAGVVTLNISTVLVEPNKSLDIIVQDYPVERCPDKRAAVSIGFRWRVLEENKNFNKSLLNDSIMSVMSEELKTIPESREYQELFK